MEKRFQSINDRRRAVVALHSVKKAKKQTISAAGLKGFGAVVTTSSSTTNDRNSNALQIDIDRSKPILSFYANSFQQSSIASENFKRTALAYTYHNGRGPNDSYKLRGVVTTRDIPKGSDLITLPYEMAIDLGPEGNDPTIPALAFLKDYCAVMSNSATSAMNSDEMMMTKRKLHYYRLLPTYDSIDCRGCTTFYTEEALHALQCPYMIHETNQCKFQIQQRLEQVVMMLPHQQQDHDSESTSSIASDSNGQRSSFMWMDGVTPINIEHMTWAVWIITSRVLTVQTGHSDKDDDSGPIQYRRLLIPYLDMCNHDRTSIHQLTGRATKGGLLRIVAGHLTKSGTPIEICYGGGQSGNDRFLQEYGFLDTHMDAYKMVAMDLLGLKRRGNSDNSYRSMQDRNECLAALRTTTIADDEQLLLSIQQKNEAHDANIPVAIQYRIGLKKALQELNGETW
jgi:hypothetical protein